MTSPMIENPLGDFQQWLPARSEQLRRMEKEAAQERIPIVGPVVGQLLYILVRLLNAKMVVELGTATGYSAIFMAKACLHSNGRVVSYESSSEFAARAKVNIRQAGLDQVAQVRCEDVFGAMAGIDEAVDMIFMDIEKEDYLRALPECLRLLRPGGLLFVDNTGFKAAHPFNQAIHDDPAWEMVNIWSFLPRHSPEHDGICLALKK